MIEAELADGTVLEFPDGTPPDVIQRTVRARSVPPIPKPGKGPELEALGSRGGGGSFASRSLAGIKLTREGQVNFLKDRFGAVNVGLTSGGQIIFRDPEKPEAGFQMFNPEGFDVGDIGEFGAPALIEAAPTVLAGSNPVTVGGAAAVGNIARQAAAEMLPGEESVSLGERAASVGLSAALGGVTQKGANLLTRGADVIRPSNIVARQIQRRRTTPVAQQGRRLAQRTGTDLTFGQETQSRSILTLEGLLRRHPASADIIARSDANQLDRSLRFLNGRLDRMSRTGGAGGTGTAVRRALEDTVEKAARLRSRNARVAFGAADEAAGGQPVIALDNTLRAIDGLIDDFDVAGGGDATATLVSRLKSLRKLFGSRVEGPIPTQATGPASRLESPAKMQRLLQIYGNASRGKGKIFQDIDTAQQRMVAGRIFSALRDDLDAAVEVAGIGSNSAAALRAARDAYRADSAIINEIQESVIGRLVGGQSSVESIADTVARMSTSEARETIDLLARHSPEVAQQAKRFMVEKAMETAGIPRSLLAPAPRLMTGEQAFSPAKFATAIRKSPFWDVATREERAAIGNATRLLERLANRAGTDGSPTGPLLFAADLVKALGRGAVDLDPIQLGRIVTAAVAPRRLARAATTPQGRAALATITRSGEAPRKVLGALLFIGGTGVRETIDAPGSQNVPEIQKQPLQDQPLQRPQ